MQVRHFLLLAALLLAITGGLLFVYEAPQMYWVGSLGIACALFTGQMLDTALTWKGTRLSILPVLLAVISISYWFWIFLGQNEMQVLLWCIGSTIFPVAGISLMASVTPAHRTRSRMLLLASLSVLGFVQMLVLLDQARHWGYFTGMRTDWILLLYFLNLIAVDLTGKWKQDGMRHQQDVVIAGLWYTAFEYLITYVID